MNAPVSIKPLEFDALMRCFDVAPITAKPRRPLFEPGAWGSHAIFVKAGILALYRVEQNRRAIVALRYAGEAVIEPRERADYGVQAIEPSDVALVRDFSYRQRNLPAEALLALLALERRNDGIAREWLTNNRRDCTGRVAHILCETAVRLGFGPRGMVQPLTQQDIADATGQTSVNVNRALAEIERDMGLIERSNRHIRFKDWAGLCRLAGFDGSYLA